MTSPVERFVDLALQAEMRPGVTRNRRGSLVLEGGGVRAMTSHGAIVVKLHPARVQELVLAREGTHYKGQVNAWLELASALPAGRCRELIDEALRK